MWQEVTQDSDNAVIRNWALIREGSSPLHITHADPCTRHSATCRRNRRRRRRFGEKVSKERREGGSPRTPHLRGHVTAPGFHLHFKLAQRQAFRVLDRLKASRADCGAERLHIAANCVIFSQRPSGVFQQRSSFFTTNDQVLISPMPSRHDCCGQSKLIWRQLRFCVCGLVDVKFPQHLREVQQILSRMFSLSLSF